MILYVSRGEGLNHRFVQADHATEGSFNEVKFVLEDQIGRVERIDRNWSHTGRVVRRPAGRRLGRRASSPIIAISVAVVIDYPEQG